MYTLAPDEKATTVIVYSPNQMIHGDLVTKKEVRVSIWPRMQNLPIYIHLLKVEMLLFSGASYKSLTYDEYYFPSNRIIGFHLAPPESDPLDYDADAPLRTMLNVEMMLGAYMLKGKVRISTHSDFATMIEVSHMTWFSVYDAEISHPFLPQLPPIHVPMLLAYPTQVSFGM